MNMEALKHELCSLNPEEQRQLVAFLVSLEDARVTDFRKKRAEKIAPSASDFATLEDLDRRLGLIGGK
jgi:hypothetical protein